MTAYLRLTGLRVTKIEERFELAAHKDSDGRFHTKNRSLGWYITIEPLGISICVGSEQPPFDRTAHATLIVHTPKSTPVEVPEP